MPTADAGYRNPETDSNRMRPLKKLLWCTVEESVDPFSPLSHSISISDHLVGQHHTIASGAHHHALQETLQEYQNIHLIKGTVDTFSVALLYHPYCA